MVSIKIKLRHSSVSGVPGTVVYVLHEGPKTLLSDDFSKQFQLCR